MIIACGEVIEYQSLDDEMKKVGIDSPVQSMFVKSENA